MSTIHKPRWAGKAVTQAAILRLVDWHCYGPPDPMPQHQQDLERLLHVSVLRQREGVIHYPHPHYVGKRYANRFVTACRFWNTHDAARRITHYDYDVTCIPCLRAMGVYVPPQPKRQRPRKGRK